MKRSQPRRDWSAARAKVEDEGFCRLHGESCEGPLEAAHIIGRDRDFYVTIDPDDGCYPAPYKMHSITFKVHPWRVVPLCQHHHRLYDAGRLDLLGALSLEEELQAIQDSSVNGGPGLESARVRLAPSQYGSRGLYGAGRAEGVA